MAKRLKKKDINIVPGYQLCRECEKQLDLIDKSEEDESMSENEQSKDHEFSAAGFTPPRKKLNKTLSSIGSSPINLHSISQHSRGPTAKRKLAKVSQKLKENLVEAYSIEDFNSNPSEAPISKDVQEKAKELDELHEALKAKLMTACYSDKVQILTLIPDSWSRSFAAKYFNVSVYMIRTARELKKEKGILARPIAKRGKELLSETLQLVLNFFEDDEYSRIMPGKKDCVSVGRNIYKQKRLILCNL